MRTRLSIVFSVLAAYQALWGQGTPVSQISGIVVDSTGLAVPAAQVSITNTDTAAVRTVQSGPDGAYILSNLPVGPYRLQVTKEGFSAYVQSGIVLQVNTNPEINVTLKIGSVSEQVMVEANAAMVETHSNGVGQVIDQQRVIDLPLNGRNVTQLIGLSGAAISNTGGGIVNNLNYPTVAAFSIAGGQGNATNYFLDGATHIDPRTNVGLPLPFPDALQEFKVETSALPANYGSHPGGAVNAITRSGTNSIHGDAFEFLRNYVFNARNVFSNARDSLKRNQFGGVLGGPIVKNKLFFFTGFQGTTERTAPATTVAFVPTADTLKGNFQTILAPPCQKNPVMLNVASGASNNIIPGNKLNPIAVKFAQLIPVSTDPCGKLVYGVPSIDNEHQGVARADWQRTPTDSVFFRYFVANYNLAAFYDKSNLLTAGAPGLLDQVQALNAGDTYLISSRTVSSFRATFSRSAINRVGADGVPNMQQLGSNIAAPIPNYTGQIQISNYFSTGAIPGYVFTNIYGLTEDIGMTLGAHQLAFGANWTHTQMNALGPFQMNPRMTFNGQLTGNALADFLTGNLDTMLQGGGQYARDGQNMPSLYVQDSWRITPHFQLNAGLRWDPFIPQHQAYSYATQFEPSKFYSGQVSKVFVNAPPGVTFAGDVGFPGMSDTFPRYADFAPRIGLVYDPRGRGTETIRAAYGIFYDSSYMWNTLHVPLNPPWGETITLNAPPGGLSDPWQGYPGGNPFPPPTRFASDFKFPVGGTYVFEPLHAHATYLQQWNLAIQKQFGPDWLVSATYLGNKTTHQWLGFQIDPAVYIPGGSCTLQGVTYTPCSSTASTNARRIFAQANPSTGKYLGDVSQIDDGGNASYNALLLVAQHRFSHNFSALANYTWSHCFDQGEANQDIGNAYQNPANRLAEWASCASDRRQLLNVSLVVQSPAYSERWIQRIAGNWQFSSIFTDTSGAALNVTDGTDVSLTAVGADRPNVVGTLAVSDQAFNNWFNTAAFQKQAAGTFGNAGRNLVRGPANWNLDAALWRVFPIRENIKLNLRWEAFNVVNHTRFGNPTTALNAGTFGQITTALDPRIMQVALKIAF